MEIFFVVACILVFASILVGGYLLTAHRKPRRPPRDVDYEAGPDVIGRKTVDLRYNPLAIDDECCAPVRKAKPAKTMAELKERLGLKKAAARDRATANPQSSYESSVSTTTYMAIDYGTSHSAPSVDHSSSSSSDYSSSSSDFGGGSSDGGGAGSDF